MKYLKVFEDYHDLEKKFREVALSAVEYFKTDDEIDVDVRFYNDGLPFTLKNMEDHSKDFKRILREHELDLESYDDDSVCIIKRPFYKDSAILNDINKKSGVFETLKP